MPVLPLVDSTIALPGPRTPRCSASHSIAAPRRSLTEYAGLRPSIFPRMRAGAPSVTRFKRTSGVRPIECALSSYHRGMSEFLSGRIVRRDGRRRQRRRARSQSRRRGPPADEDHLVDARVAHEAGRELQPLLKLERERRDDAVVDVHRVHREALEPPHTELQERGAARLHAVRRALREDEAVYGEEPLELRGLVAPAVSDELVEEGPRAHVERHREDERAAGPEDARDLGERALVRGDVLDDVERAHEIERRGAIGERGDVGARRDAALGRERACRRTAELGEVRAGDRYARAHAGADLEARRRVRGELREERPGVEIRRRAELHARPQAIVEALIHADRVATRLHGSGARGRRSAAHAISYAARDAGRVDG